MMDILGLVIALTTSYETGTFSVDLQMVVDYNPDQ